MTQIWRLQPFTAEIRRVLESVQEKSSISESILKNNNIPFQDFFEHSSVGQYSLYSWTHYNMDDGMLTRYFYAFVSLYLFAAFSTGSFLAGQTGRPDRANVTSIAFQSDCAFYNKLYTTIIQLTLDRPNLQLATCQHLNTIHRINLRIPRNCAL